MKNRMRVLVACEFSGTVRDAFSARGWDAWSCDLLPSELPGQHIQGDALAAIRDAGPWDLLIAHPPCTYLCSSGLHWNGRRAGRAALTEAAVEFARALIEAPVPMRAVENPIGCLSKRVREPDQIIQPWQFGEDASKATCLWLHGLPPLKPTKFIPPKTRRLCGQVGHAMGEPDGQRPERSASVRGSMGGAVEDLRRDSRRDGGAVGEFERTGGMSICTHDNPTTFMREVWLDGVKIDEHHRDTLTTELWHKAGALPGPSVPLYLITAPWQSGRLAGDIDAMQPPRKIERT